MNIDKKLTEILTSTLVIENKKGIPFAVAKIKELIVMNQSKEETAKDLPGEKQSISETFKQLREIAKGGFWDNCKCVCSALGRGKCELNCAEYEA